MERIFKFSFIQNPLQDKLYFDRTPEIQILKLFQEASKHAYPEAQYRLGLCYMNGYGTQTDIGQGNKAFVLWW